MDNKSSGIGFTSLLQAAFIVLKLCNVINWSWIWVLSPTWINTSIALLILGAYVVYLWRKSKKEQKQLRKSVSAWQQRIDKMKEQRKNQE